MKLFTLLAILALSSAFAQTKRDFNELPEVWPDTTHLKTDSLVFKPITQKEFNEISLRRAKTKKKLNVVAAFVKDSTLTVTTKHSVFEFPDAGGYEASWDYVEYIPELRAHLLDHCGEGACFADLLDDETDEKMYVPSFYDQGLMGLDVSPSGKYLLVYSSYDGPDYTHYYSYRAEFVVFKIEKGKGLKGISYHRDCGFADWSIDQIVWADNNTLALKVYTKNRSGDGEDMVFEYYKTVIK